MRQTSYGPEDDRPAMPWRGARGPREGAALRGRGTCGKRESQ